MKNYLILFLLLIGSVSVFAQKPKDFGIKSRKALNYYLLGKQQVEFRDMAKAMDFFEKAIKLEPNFTDAHFLMVYAADKKGKLKMVKPSLVHLANQQDKRYQLAKTWYAKILEQEGNYPEARKWFLKFLASDPEDPQEKKNAEVNLRKCDWAEREIKHFVFCEPSPGKYGEFQYNEQ